MGSISMKNQEKSINNKALDNTVSIFGNILPCKVICEDRGPQGFDFVHSETREAARQAINILNGMQLNDRKVFMSPFKS